MNRLAFLLACGLTLVYSAPSSAIDVVASSDVVAPNCCNTGTVRIYNEVGIYDSNSTWAQEPFSHMWLATVTSCDRTYNNFAEVCCITATGNFRAVTTTISAICPIETKGRSYGWIGGYGPFPYHEDEMDSFCLYPCYCGGGGGEEDPGTRGAVIGRTAEPEVGSHGRHFSLLCGGETTALMMAFT